jgi:hypothetical protein
MPTTILIVEDEILIAIEMEMVIEDLSYRSAGIADDMHFALKRASIEIDVALALAHPVIVRKMGPILLKTVFCPSDLNFYDSLEDANVVLGRPASLR